MKLLVAIGNMKLRRRQYVVGISGVAKVVSRHTKMAPRTTAAAPAAYTAAEFQPTIGPMLSTSIPAVTAPARLQLPTQSMPAQTFERRPVAASSCGHVPPAPPRGQQDRHHQRGDDQQHELAPEQGAPPEVLDDRRAQRHAQHRASRPDQ